MKRSRDATTGERYCFQPTLFETGYVLGRQFITPTGWGRNAKVPNRVPYNKGNEKLWMEPSEFLDQIADELSSRDEFIQIAGMPAFLRNTPLWAIHVDSLLTQSAAAVLTTYGADKVVDCL
jgi:hypothetical protein